MRKFMLGSRVGCEHSLRLTDAHIHASEPRPRSKASPPPRLQALAPGAKTAMAEPVETGLETYGFLTACPKNGFLNHYNLQSNSRNPPDCRDQGFQGLGLLGLRGRKPPALACGMLSNCLLLTP